MSFERITRKPSPAEKAEYDAIRQKVQEEFPPARSPKLKPAQDGIGAEVRRARKERGLSWSEVAQRAELAKSSIVRDIEYGLDVQLSQLEAVARTLGLKLELVDAAS